MNLAWVVSFIGASPFLIFFTGENADEWAKKGHYQVISIIDNYITKKTEELEVLPPKECIEQKNRIYRQLGKDECVTNFRLGGHPSIPKKDFHLYLSEIIDEKPTYIGLTNISVFSPDWHGERSWRGRVEILNNQERSFDFERKLTNRFWDYVRRDKLKLHTTDEMQVQLIEFPIRKVNHRIIRVLSHNGTPIDTPLSDDVINSMCRLSDFEALQNTQPQGDFFK